MQPRWKDGCRGMLTVNAIFAGFSAVFLVNLVVRVNDIQELWFYLSCGLVMLALYLFAMASEWITDALDEGELDIYIGTMKAYNFGVISILLSLSAFLVGHSRPYLAGFAAVAIIFPWGKDLWWLLFASEKEKQDYRNKLSRTD